MKYINKYLQMDMDIGRRLSVSEKKRKERKEGTGRGGGVGGVISNAVPN